MSDKTIFEKIIDRELPAHIVYEDELAIAIMDIFPSVAGQVVVIPKKPLSYIFDLPDDLYGHLLAVTKRVAKALDTAFDTSRTCVVVEGFEVPHVHIKLYPLAKSETALTSVLMHTQPAEEDEMETHCAAIKKAL